jgi:MFS family permease
MPRSRAIAARRGAFAVFLMAGWLPAAWATRIPAIKAELDLGDGGLAVAILGLEGGAVVGLPLGAALIGRLGSRRALRIGFAAFAPALAAVGVAPGLATLTAALVAMALANSVVDVALNTTGIELERRLRVPLLSRLHAGHPLGLVVGGLAGAAATAAGLPVAAHLAIAGSIGLVVALAATVWLVDEDRAAPGPALARPSRRTSLLGLLAFCAFALDGAAANWSAVDLRSEHGASPAVAAAGFTGFALTVAIGRLFGDRLVGRLGRARLVRVGAALSAAAAALVVLAPGAALGLTGWMLLGLGLATIAPTVLGAAPELDEAPPAVAIAAVTTIGYLGSFTVPPAIGALAEGVGLSTALLALIAVSAVLGALAGLALPDRPPGAPHADAAAR